MSNWGTRLIEALSGARATKRNHLRRLAERPEDPLAMLRVAEVFARQGETERAVLLYRRAAERFGSTGQIARAGAALRLAQRLAPTDRGVNSELSKLDLPDEPPPASSRGPAAPRNQRRERS